MGLEDTEIPDDLRALVDGAGRMSTFESEDRAVEAALAEFFDEHDAVRRAAAAEVYRSNEAMSVEAAARLADADVDEMLEFFDEYGVERHTGAETDTQPSKRDGADSAVLELVEEHLAELGEATEDAELLDRVLSSAETDDASTGTPSAGVETEESEAGPAAGADDDPSREGVQR